MDDYFYLDIGDTDSDLAFDQKAYDASGKTGTSVSARKEWRRENVNTLVKDMFKTIKGHNPDMLFGISPAGNIENNQTGYLCADVKKWCSTPGYVDYIAPQVYWSFSHSLNYAKFNNCVNDWSALTTCDEVRLIIGLAPYRAVKPTEGGSDPDWYAKKDNIKRMLEFCGSHEKVSGWIMFKYESIYDINTGEYISDTKEEQEAFLPLMKVES